MSHTRYTSIGELITDTTIIRHFVCLRPRHTSDLLFDKPCINSFNYLLYFTYLLLAVSLQVMFVT